MSQSTAEDLEFSRRDILKNIGVSAGAATLGITGMSGEAEASCQFDECTDYDTNFLNPVPGGAPVFVYTSRSTGEGETGTAGAPFYHPDYDSFGWIMSGHVAGEEGRTVYQDKVDEIDKMGPVREIDMKYEEDGEYYLIDYAFVEDQTLEDMVGDEDAFYVQGRNTCRNTTTIESVEERDGDEVAVRADGSVLEGDSGGALFYKDGDDAYIAGIATAVDNCQTIFTTAETIQDRTGGFF